MSESEFNDSNEAKLTEFMHEITMKGYKYQFSFRILNIVSQKPSATILLSLTDGYLPLLLSVLKPVSLLH